MITKFLATDAAFANVEVSAFHHGEAWFAVCNALVRQTDGAAGVYDFDCADYLQFTDEENAAMEAAHGSFGDRVIYKGEVIGFIP